MGIMLRYFVAIEPPPDQRSRIAAVMSRLGDDWPVPHITLKSPRGLTPDLAWLPAVRAAAARSRRLEVRIGPPATFDDRVLYLSVEGPGLAALHRALLRATISVRPDDAELLGEKPFVPHLTLAVTHGDVGLPAYEKLADTLGDLEPFVVEELTVFERDEPRTHYQAWTRLPLAD